MRRVLFLIFPFLAAFGAKAAERAIDLDVQVAAPVEAVWKAWTTTEGIKTFFAPEARVELAVGGPFEIYINPFAPPGLKGADDMRIIGFQENRMLSFTWNAPPSLPEARKQRTIVILRFQSDGANATRVHLHHVGWGDGGEWDKAYDYFARAWPNVFGNLAKRFATGPIDWTEWLEQMKKTQAPT
jgi:uncharacterized protein YndB with AHSA1/START domain